MNESVRELLSLVGSITILWAKMEGTIDACNLLVLEFGDGRSIESERPISLKRKLRFLRQCHKRLPVLSTLQNQADELIDRINNSKQRRHDLVHGVALTIPTGDVLEVMTLNPDGANPPGTFQSFTSNDLRAFYNEVVDIFELAEDHFQAMLSPIMSNSGGDLDGGFSDQ